jgi:hypothetical protein
MLAEARTKAKLLLEKLEILTRIYEVEDDEAGAQ